MKEREWEFNTEGKEKRGNKTYDERVHAPVVSDQAGCKCSETPTSSFS